MADIPWWKSYSNIQNICQLIAKNILISAWKNKPHQSLQLRVLIVCVILFAWLFALIVCVSNINMAIFSRGYLLCNLARDKQESKGLLPKKKERTPLKVFKRNSLDHTSYAYVILFIYIFFRNYSYGNLATFKRSNANKNILSTYNITMSKHFYSSQAVYKSEVQFILLTIKTVFLNIFMIRLC